MWRLIWTLLIVVASVSQDGAVILGGFSNGWRDDWHQRHLGGDETIYRVVADGGDRVLEASSASSATALYRFVRPGSASSISWRWKVAGSLPVTADERSREADDYAARLFVIFGSGELGPQTRALCYVWAASRPIGSTYRSPAVDSVMTIVVESGDDLAGTWVQERRDFAADYRRAFGTEPDAVASVALLVDTDDTRTTVWARFDDIIIR